MAKLKVWRVIGYAGCAACLVWVAWLGSEVWGLYHMGWGLGFQP